jgi:probable HAF family extracellular repeat protein
MGMAVNNQGQVVGMSDLTGDEAFHATLWQEGAITDLGTLAGDVSAFASGINDKGQVVGTSIDASGNIRAFIWQDGVMTDLSTLFPAGFYLYPTMANKINSRGQIAGMSTDLNDGTIHAFLATPIHGAANGTVARRNGTRVAPKVTLPENVRRMVLRFGRSGIGVPRSR